MSDYLASIVMNNSTLEKLSISNRSKPCTLAKDIVNLLHVHIDKHYNNATVMGAIFKFTGHTNTTPEATIHEELYSEIEYIHSILNETNQKLGQLINENTLLKREVESLKAKNLRSPHCHKLVIKHLIFQQIIEIIIRKMQKKALAGNPTLK